MRPSLSIVAVVIDNPEVTKRFISSIRQYTTGDYELILVDNASKDKKNIDFYKEAADKYFRFDTITDLAKAWNKGIELSEGEFVAVVNNDTVVPRNWSELLIETLQKNEKAGMVSPLTFWLLSSIFKYKMLKNWDHDMKNPQPFTLQPFKEVVWGEFCVFKKGALEKVGGFQEVYKKLHGEDLEMSFQLFDKGYDIYVDPRVFVYHEGGVSHISEIRPKSELDEIRQKNFELFKSRWSQYTKDW